MKDKKILLIEGCNFVDYPTGGHLSFAVQMLSAFGNQLALVGITTEKDFPVGIWTKRIIDGIEYDYFAFQRVKKNDKKPFIPARLKNYFCLLKNRDRIKKIGIDNVFIQTFDTYLAVYRVGFKNICYRFAGLDNPFTVSRYWVSKFFSSIYEIIFLRKLSSTKLILAAADKNGVGNFNKYLNNINGSLKVIQFSTRVNTSIFKKNDKVKIRKRLMLPSQQKIVITSGRLGWFKGWHFLIDSFLFFRNNNIDAHLYFIGDGEDKLKIEDYIQKKGLENFVHLLGYLSHEKLADYLNASDLYIMGSYKEGWSTSLVEAVSCGVPCCVTNFSSAKEIITEGKDGFIAERHDEGLFAKLMNKALLIDRNSLPNQSKILKYSNDNLKNDLMSLWELK
ncbi:MAG: glycosyltransferase family 4 protein [Ignavibacteriaceae bacterium]|nr:glycosyltransferase family 4 protein [Ignavibacteriaceae bacterium]